MSVLAMVYEFGAHLVHIQAEVLEFIPAGQGEQLALVLDLNGLTQPFEDHHQLTLEGEFPKSKEGVFGDFCHRFAKVTLGRRRNKIRKSNILHRNRLIISISLQKLTFTKMAGFTPLTRAIQELGMSPQKFALEKLDLKYTTFSYRVRVGHLHLDDYHRILYFTGKTFEELFPNPLRLTPRFPESITISKRPKTPFGPDQYHISDHPRPETPPVQEQKKEADYVSASAPAEFVPVDIGIPPIDSPTEY